MGVADITEVAEPFEDARELAGVGVDVIREDVLVDRPARRGVHGQELAVLVADRQRAEVRPAVHPAGVVDILLKLLPRPEARAFRAGVEVVGLVDHRKVMVAHE